MASRSSTMILPPMTPSQSSLHFRDGGHTMNAVISPPSMKAMTPLAMDDAALMHHSSSTESAQDNAEMNRAAGSQYAQYPETPRRRPSKIPLAGQKTYVAPKPPTGKVIQQVRSSGPPSNRSLSKSTSSLTPKYGNGSGPASITKTSPSPNRSESAQSWRKDTSLEKSQARQSSIPVSAKGTSPASATSTPTRLVANHNITTSPVLRTKRDSLTSRVKNLDSLSRMQSQAPPQSTAPNLTNNSSATSSSVASSINNKLNSSATMTSSAFSTKKDFLSSSSGGALRAGSSERTKPRPDQPTVPVRRVSQNISVARYSSQLSSAASVGGSQDNIDAPSTSSSSSSQPDAAKVRSGFRSQLWNWLKI